MRAGIKPFLAAIAYFQRSAAQGVVKHVVDGQQNVIAGAEILAQRDHALRGPLGIVKAGVFIKEQARLRQAEAVDALLDIPHHEQAAVFSVQPADDGLLDAGYILILIHKQGLVVGLLARADGGILQAGKRQMLQIGIIPQLPGTLVFAVALVGPFGQGAQRAQGGQRIADIIRGLLRLGIAAGQQAQRGVQAILCRLAQGLEPFAQFLAFLRRGF